MEESERADRDRTLNSFAAKRAFSFRKAKPSGYVSLEESPKNKETESKRKPIHRSSSIGRLCGWESSSSELLTAMKASPFTSVASAATRQIHARSHLMLQRVRERTKSVCSTSDLTSNDAFSGSVATSSISSPHSKCSSRTQQTLCPPPSPLSAKVTKQRNENGNKRDASLPPEAPKHSSCSFAFSYSSLFPSDTEERKREAHSNAAKEAFSVEEEESQKECPKKLLGEHTVSSPEEDEVEAVEAVASILLEEAVVPYHSLSWPLSLKGRSLSLPSLCQPDEESLQSESSSRLFLVLQELYETEKSYLEDLCTLRDCYYLPLKTAIETGLISISSEKLHAIFANLEELINIHATLFRALDDNQTSRQDQAKKYAEAFEKVMPYFRAYALYCNNYSSATSTCNALRKSDEVFEDFLQKVRQEEECRGLDLSSFLIKPVQRICKYPLFFKDMLKCIGTSHPYFEALSNTLQEAESIAENVNEKMQKAASQSKVFDIFTRLGGEVADLVDPTRVYLSEGLIDMKSESSQRKEYHYFLFSDLLLLARPNASFLKKTSTSGGLHLKFRWSLRDVRLTSLFSRERELHSCFRERSSGREDETDRNGITAEHSARDGESCRNVAKEHLEAPEEPQHAIEEERGKEREEASFALLVSGTAKGKKGFSATVNKYQIWCKTQSQRDELARVIEERVEFSHKIADELKSRTRSSSASGTRKWAAARRSRVERQSLYRESSNASELLQRYQMKRESLIKRRESSLQSIDQLSSFSIQKESEG